jgi:hypothetical protein
MKQTPFVTAQARRLVAEFRRDRRRLTVLGALLLLGIVLTIRSANTAGPSPAQAATPLRTAAALSSEADEETIRANNTLRMDYLRRLNRNQTRDLFQPNEMFFPLPPAPVKAAPVVEAVTEVSADLQLEIQRRHVLKDAQSLKLQSTMLGSRGSVASINDNTLAIGDVISGFRVIDIQSNRCTVEKNGVTVMLTIMP